jgi:hypothetical protein
LKEGSANVWEYVEAYFLTMSVLAIMGVVRLSDHEQNIIVSVWHVSDNGNNFHNCQELPSSYLDCIFAGWEGAVPGRKLSSWIKKR